jgi:hypothetical protein
VQITSATQTQTITNTGTANLVFGSGAVALTGTHSSDFTIVADNCSSQTVTPNSTCTVTYTFRPSATGVRAANLVFTDNASGSPHSVALNGTGEVAAPSDSSSDNGKAREQEEARAREVAAAKTEISTVLSSGGPLTVAQLASAEITGVTPKNISLINAEIAKLPEEKKSDLAAVERIVFKFALVDKITDKATITSADLVKGDLVPEDSKIKTSILSALRKLPASSLDSYEKVKAAVIAVENKAAERKARLAALLAKRR